eukprot:3482959-Amphidinium_carterae.1
MERATLSTAKAISLLQQSHKIHLIVLALYMWDDHYFKGIQYRLTNYSGPQCRGLLGDFVYMAPGVSMPEGIEGQLPRAAIAMEV